MKKKLSIILALLLIMVGTLCSCKSETGGIATGTGSGTGNTVTYEGNSYEIPSDLSKVVCYSPSVALILSDLGKTNYIVGCNQETSDCGATTARVVESSEISTIVPDIVFYEDDSDIEGVSTSDIITIKIPDITSIKGIRDMISMVSSVFSATTSGDTLNDKITSAIEFGEKQAGDTKYSVLIDLGNGTAVGTGTYLTEAASACGFETIFNDKTGNVDFSEDDIIKLNPAYIFTVGSSSDYTDNSAYASIDAVKNGNVYELDEFSTIYPSSKIVNSIETMYNTITDLDEG